MPTTPEHPDAEPPSPSTPERITEVVRSAKRIAVVGLSPKQNRPSHGVAAYLQREGYTIIPIHPAGGTTLSRTVYPDLRAAAAAAGPIDIVDIFRRSEYVAALTDDILAIRPKLVWMQVGIRDTAVAARLEAAGIAVVMDRCLAVDHMHLRLPHR